MAKRSLPPFNFTPVPNILIDELLPALKPAELKVILYILRRTWGFGKPREGVSWDQIQSGNGHDRGTGLSRTAVYEALESLIERGFIEKTGRTSPEGTSLPSFYAILFAKPDTRVRATEPPPVHPTEPFLERKKRNKDTPIVPKGDPEERTDQPRRLEETDLKKAILRLAKDLSVSLPARTAQEIKKREKQWAEDADGAGEYRERLYGALIDYAADPSMGTASQALFAIRVKATDPSRVEREPYVRTSAQRPEPQVAPTPFRRFIVDKLIEHRITGGTHTIKDWMWDRLEARWGAWREGFEEQIDDIFSRHPDLSAAAVIQILFDCEPPEKPTNLGPAYQPYKPATNEEIEREIQETYERARRHAEKS